MYSTKVVFIVPIMIIYQKKPDQNKDLSSKFENNKHPNIDRSRLFCQRVGVQAKLTEKILINTHYYTGNMI